MIATSSRLVLVKRSIFRKTWGVAKAPGAAFDPPLPLTWPLEVGKWGETTGKWGRDPFRFTWSIDAYEEVSVPAGTFKAFRITYSISRVHNTTMFAPTTGLKTWYAPEARQLVKMEAGGSLWLGFQIVALDRPAPAPLQVALVEPLDQAHSATDRLTLTGRATGGKGVAKITLSLNGQEVSRQEEKGTAKPEIPLTVPLTLQEGKNVLLVTATDPEGTTQQEARTLFYDKPAPVTPPPTPATPTRPAPPVVAQPTPIPVPAPPVMAAPGPSVAIPKPAPPATTTTSPPPALPPPAPPTPAVTGPPPPPTPVVVAPTRPAPPAPVTAAPPAPAPLATATAAPAPAPVVVVPPVRLAIASPLDQARMEHESVAVAGMVSGGKGIGRVLVTLNGHEVSRQEESTPQETMAINLPLTLREGQNTLVVTATETGGKLHQEVRTVHYEKREPLAVAVRYPAEQTRLQEETIVLAAVVTSSKGVAKVTVTVNGTEVHQQTERTPQKSLVVTAPLTLREGSNAIVVSATEPDGATRQEIRTVFFDKPKVAVAAPPPPPQPTQSRWAVVVGVGRYESPDIPRLRYTVPDAEAIYQVLTGPAGFKPEHVILMTDKTERKPTLRNLK